MLCDHLKGWDWEGGKETKGWDWEGGKETQEGGDMGIYVYI